MDLALYQGLKNIRSNRFFSVWKQLDTTRIHFSASRQRVTDRGSDFSFSQEGSLAESMVPDTCPGSAWLDTIPGACLREQTSSWATWLWGRKDRTLTWLPAKGGASPWETRQEASRGNRTCLRCGGCVSSCAQADRVCSVTVFSAFCYRALEHCLCPSTLKVKL